MQSKGQLLSYFNRLSSPDMLKREIAMRADLENARNPEEKASGIPVFDLQLYSKDPEAWSHVLVDDLAKNGFALFKNHGLPIPDIDRAYDAVHALNTLPDDVKEKYFVDKGGQRGLGRYGAEQHFSARNTNGDKKSYFMFGREDMTAEQMAEHKIAPNVWPDQPPGLRDTLLTVNAGMRNVQTIIEKALSVGLGLGENVIPDTLKNGDHITRANYYPPLGDVPDTGGERSGEHTDGGFMTLLLASRQRGLVVMPDRYDESTWIRPDTNPEYMVFNIGRGADRMTRGFLPATWHKVEDPADHSAWRVSLPLFAWQGLNEKIFEVECPAPVAPSKSRTEVTEGLINKFPAGTLVSDFLKGTLSVQRLAMGEKPPESPKAPGTGAPPAPGVK